MRNRKRTFAPPLPTTSTLSRVTKTPRDVAPSHPARPKQPALSPLPRIEPRLDGHPMATLPIPAQLDNRATGPQRPSPHPRVVMKVDAHVVPSQTAPSRQGSSLLSCLAPSKQPACPTPFYFEPGLEGRQTATSPTPPRLDNRVITSLRTLAPCLDSRLDGHPSSTSTRPFPATPAFSRTSGNPRGAALSHPAHSKRPRLPPPPRFGLKPNGHPTSTPTIASRLSNQVARRSRNPRHAKSSPKLPARPPPPHLDPRCDDSPSSTSPTPSRLDDYLAPAPPVAATTPPSPRLKEIINDEKASPNPWQTKPAPRRRQKASRPPPPASSLLREPTTVPPALTTSPATTPISNPLPLPSPTPLPSTNEIEELRRELSEQARAIEALEQRIRDMEELEEQKVI
jgi:hypothetical protein